MIGSAAAQRETEQHESSSSPHHIVVLKKMIFSRLRGDRAQSRQKLRGRRMPPPHARTQGQEYEAAAAVATAARP